MNKFFMRSNLLLFCGFLIASFSLSAQAPTAFSEQPAAFVKELGEYLTASQQKKQEQLFKDFEKQYKAGLFTPEEMPVIIATANGMLGQRMTASPYFSQYMKDLLLVKRAENGEARFQQWHGILQKMLADIQNRKVKPYLEFLKFSEAFFAENALRYSRSGVTWRALADEFELAYEAQRPVLKYAQADLLATRKQDSIRIYKTSGAYDVTSGEWQGAGGRVTWERHGLDPEVYVELDSYRIETKMALYEAKKATLYYPTFFGNTPIEGSFSDKIVSGTNINSYPRFESFNRRQRVDNIGDGVGFIGGFRLQGTTVYGFGSKDEPAELKVTDEFNNRRYQGYSQLFTIRRAEQIVGERVRSTLYFGQDSVYHPSVNVRLKIPEKVLALTRGERGSDRNPFYNSLQQVSFTADNLDYHFTADSIVIGKKKIAGAAKSPVTFESLNFFDIGDYTRLQGIASYNPIAILKVVGEREGRVMNADDLASKINSKFTVENIQTLLYDLVAEGFVDYDAEDQEVTIKDKVFLYADAAARKVDHDALRILSDTDETNGTFNTKTNQMQMEGVDRVEFSPKHRVAVEPSGRRLTMGRDRDLDVDGTLIAGYGIFRGKDFHFDYDKYQFDLDSARYLDLYVPIDAASAGNEDPEPKAISSRIEHLTGVLLIEAPGNKSAREDIPLFPSINTKDNSYVFYDYPDTQGGAYTRDSFYFELDKFTINELDELTKEDLTFKGTMQSANIFPEYKETLVFMEEDASLGFRTKTPVAGYPNYSGKGNYQGNIELSNQGYLGQGTVNYLGSTVDSEDIIFTPKRMTATAERFDLEEDRTGAVEVPQARGYDVSIDWRPYQDSMYVRSEEAPFELYKAGVHNVRGTLILTPSGLKGDGVLDWPKASIESDLISFGAFSARADTMDLSIRAINADAIALTTSNLNGYVDFDRNMGEFKANEQFLKTTLPYNQYETSFNEFDWDITGETITFISNKQDKFGTFLSIAPDQDSLVFRGENAVYDLNTSLLKIDGVPEIQASDAYIYTEDGKVEIGAEGKMTTLENARIVADTISKQHVINRATVNILGRKEYRATGFYEYNVPGREQEIEFAEIVGTRVGKGKQSDKKSVTRATGEVVETDNFYIDQKTEYRGTITLNAEDPELLFEGYARLDSDKLPNRQWFSVNSKGDKTDLAISYDIPKNYAGDPLRTGIFLSKESAQPYPRILMPLYYRKDRPILPATGLLKFDEANDRFVFGDSTRVAGGSDLGNIMYFNNKDAKIEAEGKVNLSSELLYLDVNAAGTLETSYAITVDTSSGGANNNAALRGDLMTTVDLILPENLLRMLLLDFQSSSFDAPAINYENDKDFYSRAARELFGTDKDMEKVVQTLQSGTFNLPPKLNKHTFVFSKLPMVWDNDYQSFITTDTKVGLASINGEMLNRTVTGFIEFKMPTNNDDRLYIYLKSPSDYYYFFGYKQGVMNVVSNNTKFNDEVVNMKEKERIFKMDDGETYEIQPVNPGTAEAFVRRIQAGKK